MKTSTTNQALALIGMAALVPLAVYALRGAEKLSATPDLAWAALVETGEDHIGAKDLAERMLTGDRNLTLVDLRPREEYDVWHLPGAVSLTVPDLLGEPGKKILADPARLVVLYSNGPTHPGQAWVELNKRGLRNVKVLDGGLEAFKSEVLTPRSLSGAASEAQSKQSAPELAILRAFFLLGPDAKVEGAGRHATDPEKLTKPTVVSTRWLASRLEKTKVVDVRESASDYALWHLPGAVHLPQAKLRIKAGDRDLFLQPADQLATHFGQLGITADDDVVIYAEEKLQDATMVALAFARVGHDKLAILEGGVLRWAADRLPLAKAAPKVSPAVYKIRAGADTFTITVDDLAQAVRAGGTKVLDVRPPEFFSGEKSTEKRAGHIPGSVNRFYGNDLTRGETGSFFRGGDALRAEFEGLGLKPDQDVVVSCRTGHTASESYFVLRYLLGYEKARWFNGSWTEWAARADLPLETGGAKK